MSTRLSHRKQMLDLEFKLWMTMRCSDGKSYRVCLAMDNLTDNEQTAIEENISPIMNGIYQALEPYLDVDINEAGAEIRGPR